MADNYIMLQWNHSCDLGNIYYNGGYKNRIFIKTDLGAPEYEYEVEAKENGDGEIIPVTQKTRKVYKMVILNCSEPLVDALNALQMHDTVYLAYSNGLYSAQIKNIKTIVTWENDQCLATVELNFHQDDQIISNSCCTDLTVETIDDSNCDPCAIVIDYGSTDPVSPAGSSGAMQVGKKYIMREWDGASYTYTGLIGTYTGTSGGVNNYTYSECQYVENDESLITMDSTLLVFCNSEWRLSNLIQTSYVTGTDLNLVAYGKAGAYSKFYVSTDGGTNWTNFDPSEYVSDACPDTPFTTTYSISGLASGTVLKFKIETYTEDCYTGFSKVYTYTV
jgi:hypothetical protein